MALKTGSRSSRRRWGSEKSRSMQSAGTGVVAAGEVAQELVVQARGLEHALQALVGGLVVAEDREHLAVLVAELELDDPVLQRLEAARGAEHVAELHVLARRQRGQHAPLLEQLALDLLDAREALLGRAEVVDGEAREHLRRARG